MIGDKRILAVVTARAGSKGLPGKNFKSFYSRPLVQWSIMAAAASKWVDHVIVSSNCEGVKSVTDSLLANDANPGVSKHLVGFVDRPDELCGPNSKNEEALIHACQVLECQQGWYPDIVVNLQPTSPFRYNCLVDECIERMYDSDADSLVTASRHTPLFWQFRPNGLKAFFDVGNRPMRQDILPEDWLFHDDGNLYCTATDVLMDRMCRIGDSPYFFEIDKYQAMQIDDEEDFIIMEAVAQVLGYVI
jgi:CMP-N,N'-diacetyllegionaminic acid synthase